jgi:hypothetical protein
VGSGTGGKGTYSKMLRLDCWEREEWSLVSVSDGYEGRALFQSMSSDQTVPARDEERTCHIAHSSPLQSLVGPSDVLC